MAMSNSCLVVLIVLCFGIIGFGLLVSAFNAADLDLGVGIHVVFLAFLLLCFLLVIWSYRLQWLREQSKSYCNCACLPYCCRADQISTEDKEKYGIKAGRRTNEHILLEATGFPLFIRGARRAMELQGGVETCHRNPTENHHDTVTPMAIEQFVASHQLKENPHQQPQTGGTEHRKYQELKRLSSRRTGAAATAGNGQGGSGPSTSASSAPYCSADQRANVHRKIPRPNTTTIGADGDTAAPQNARPPMLNNAALRNNAAGRRGRQPPPPGLTNNKTSSLRGNNRPPPPNFQRSHHANNTKSNKSHHHQTNHRRCMVKNSFANPNRYLHQSSTNSSSNLSSSATNQYATARLLAATAAGNKKRRQSHSRKMKATAGNGCGSSYSSIARNKQNINHNNGPIIRKQPISNTPFVPQGVTITNTTNRRAAADVIS